MRVTEECNVIKAEKGFVLIELVKKPECGNCKLCAFNKKNAIRVSAKCSIECAPGDRVVVEMPEKPLCGSSLILFAIPLILLLIAVLATANCKWYVHTVDCNCSCSGIDYGNTMRQVGQKKFQAYSDR